jgi:O-antigen/teichoic acid export membrane protein
MFSLVSGVSGAPLAFAANILIARSLGVTQYGSYVAMISAALAAGGLAAYGLGPLMTRELSRQPASHQTEIFRHLGFWSLKRVGITSAFSVLVVIAWLGFLFKDSHVGWLDKALILPVIPIIAALSLASGALVGLSRVALSQAVNNIIKNAALLISIFLIIRGHYVTIGSVIGAQLLSLGLSLAIASYWIHGRLPASGSISLGGVDGKTTKAWGRSALHFFAMSASMLVLSRLDVVIISAFSNNSEAGVFGIAARASQLASLAGIVSLSWLQPRISRQSAKNDRESLRSTVKVGLLVACSLTLVSSAIGWLLAPWVMKIAGSNFASAVWPMRCLLAGYVIWSFCIPYYVVLSMSGREKVLSIILWSQAAITLSATAILGHALGANGAAYAWLLGSSFGTVAMVIAGSRLLIGLREGVSRQPVAQDSQAITYSRQI